MIFILISFEVAENGIIKWNYFNGKLILNSFDIVQSSKNEKTVKVTSVG